MKKTFMLTICTIFALLSCGCQTTEANVSSVVESNSSVISENSDTSIPVEESTDNNSQSTTEETEKADFSLLFANEEYKNELLSAASLLSEKTSFQSDAENAVPQGGDIHRLYETPYNLKFDSAFNIITGHLIYNDIMTSEEKEKWCRKVYEIREKDPTSIDGYESAWQFVQDHNLKYEDFKEKFEELHSLHEFMGEEFTYTDKELKLIFEGTKEQIIKTFKNDYTFYKNGKIYPPIVYIGKMSTEELIKAGITPDELEKAAVSMHEEYPDRQWAKWSSTKAGLYKKLCTDVKLSIDKNEKFDTEKWIEENTKNFPFLNNPYVKL